MYLPLMAVVMLAVVVGWKIVVGLRMKPVGAVIAAAGAGVLMWGTLERNRVYGSEERLWMDTVAKRPGNARRITAVGMQLGRKGDLEAVREHFETALRIDPGYHLAAHSLGQVLLSEGKTEEAEAFCNEKINSNSPIAPDAAFSEGVDPGLAAGLGGGEGGFCGGGGGAAERGGGALSVGGGAGESAGMERGGG